VVRVWCVSLLSVQKAALSEYRKELEYVNLITEVHVDWLVEKLVCVLFGRPEYILRA